MGLMPSIPARPRAQQCSVCRDSPVPIWVRELTLALSQQLACARRKSPVVRLLFQSEHKREANDIQCS